MEEIVTRGCCLLVLSAARKDKEELVHQDGTSMLGAAAPDKYPVNGL